MSSGLNVDSCSGSIAQAMEVVVVPKSIPTRTSDPSLSSVDIISDRTLGANKDTRNTFDA